MIYLLFSHDDVVVVVSVSAACVVFAVISVIIRGKRNLGGVGQLVLHSRRVASPMYRLGHQ